MGSVGGAGSAEGITGGTAGGEADAGSALGAAPTTGVVWAGRAAPSFQPCSPGPRAKEVFTRAAAHRTTEAPTAPATYFAKRARLCLAFGLISARRRSTVAGCSPSSNMSSSGPRPRTPRSATGGKLRSSASSFPPHGTATPGAAVLVLADTVGARLSAAWVEVAGTV